LELGLILSKELPVGRYFSDRHGFGSGDPAIVVREDAPPALRYAVVEIARRVGLVPSSIRNIACGVLFEAPDPGNWSEYPNIWDEVVRLLEMCEWYKVYDVAETIWRSLEFQGERQELYQDELNRLFREKGIGWELKSPLGIVFRGDANFTNATETAVVAFRDGIPLRLRYGRRSRTFPDGPSRIVPAQFSTQWLRWSVLRGT
jgi:hypothetical protein